MTQRHSRPVPPVTVSVVIPCYNGERFVASAVASALRQTRSPEEVICVDDGSTDGTLEVLRHLNREHPAVRVLTGPNGGPSAARNRGLAAASGAYVQFLDADDLLLPDKLAHQASLVEAAAEPPDLVVAAYRRRLADGQEEIQDVGEDPWTSLVEARFGITSANLWRREAVEAVGGWREGMHTSEDPELVFRLLQAGASVLRDPSARTLLCRRPDSLWNADYARSQRGWFAVRCDVVRHLAAAGLLTEERRCRVALTLFDALNALYERDRPLAGEMHAEVRRLGLTPAGGGMNRAYVWAYRFGGFRTAQGIRRVWRSFYRVFLKARREPESDPATLHAADVSPN